MTSGQLKGFLILNMPVRRKIKRAAELVCQPDVKIAGIAPALNYNDRRYFSELFRSKFRCVLSA